MATYPAYPAFETALASGDKESLFRLYDAARTQLARAEALNRGYELALSVRAQERERAALAEATAVLAEATLKPKARRAPQPQSKPQPQSSQKVGI